MVRFLFQKALAEHANWRVRASPSAPLASLLLSKATLKMRSCSFVEAGEKGGSRREYGSVTYIAHHISLHV